MLAGNQTSLKRNNRQSIINHIYRNGPTARTELAKCLNITKPTVSSSVTELIEMSVLAEAGYVAAEFGKRPQLVGFNKDYKYVLALDFLSFRTRNSVLVSVCNLMCEPIFTEQLQLGPNYSGAVMEEVMPARILQMLNINDVLLDRIGAVVMTAPTANYSNGLVAFECANGDFVNLAKIVAEHFSQPILVKNDINLAAIGEKNFGVAKGVKNLMFAWVGVAVGGAVILNDTLYEGKNNGGGELANTLVYDELTGEYEFMKNMLSLTGVMKYINRHKDKARESKLADKLLPPRVTIDDVVSAADAGDAFCLEYAQYCADKIAAMICNICSVLDLEMAIVGGEYSRFPCVVKTIEKRISLLNSNGIRVTTPQYTNSAMYGAFSVGVDYIVENIME